MSCSYCPADLPNSLSLIAEKIGFDAVVALIEFSAGRRLYIPKTLKPGHNLLELLGLEAAQKLCQEFGGQLLPIPMANELFRSARNREMLEKREEMSVAKLAAHYGLSERQIWKIVKKEKERDAETISC